MREAPNCGMKEGGRESRDEKDGKRGGGRGRKEGKNEMRGRGREGKTRCSSRKNRCLCCCIFQGISTCNWPICKDLYRLSLLSFHTLYLLCLLSSIFSQFVHA